MRAKDALVVVDVQSDFLPGGAIAVRGGRQIVPRLNAVIEAFAKDSRAVFFTRDWHPPDHVSFEGNGGMWPRHCVRDTPGAEFDSELRIPETATVISKGTEPRLEAYSAFSGTGLEKVLSDSGVARVILGGLATEYCVKETAVDALRFGFAVVVLKDCVMGVEHERGDSERALEEIISRGGRLITSVDFLSETAS